MADIETSIGISLDTSNALAAIKNLQREISAFHTSLAKGSAGASNAAASLQKDLIGNINATGQFSASMTKVRSTTESFTNSLEKNKFSMGEYFRYAGGASKTFGKNFSKEFNTIEKVARERVKDLQTQFVSMGRDANGALQAIKIRPMILDLKDAGTQMQISAQKQQIFNQLLKQGSTNLLNFGKNTQWAGRQLMVGFTLPITVFGQIAAKTFMDLEKQALRFRRVYGELFTSPEETDSMVKALKELALEFTKYGVAVEKTMELAADAAAMGETGAGLLAQVNEANRLAVLGNVDQSKALETTISVTNAFAVATEDLANKIDFLNAVENQTVTSIEDLTVAIPKAGPVVKQLGGDVEDLAFFLTAMKEGGINASEGANALKSGLAALINPTGRAADMLAGFGINVKKIVESNKGDVKGLVIDFAQALDVLDPLNRAQAIEQLFGKFQFSRLSTLFQNVIAEGTQAERVLSLANSTVSELAALSNKELGNVADSTTFRFQKSIEELRAAIAPVGEQFLKAITPIIEFATKMLNSFNSMNEGVKNFVVIGGALLAGIGPVVLMAFGLLANGVANLIKGFAAVRGMFLRTKDSSSILGEQMEYMTQEQLEASSVAASLERVHQKLEQRFTSEAVAVENLVRALQKGIAAQRRFNPQVGAAAQAAAAVNPVKLNRGTTSVPGPRGAGDIIPALLSPGEAVIPAKAAQKYAPIIEGMIAGNIPGFNKGVMLGMPGSGKSTQKNRDAAEQVYQMFLQSSYRDTPPTKYGHQLSPTSGHSFPIFGLGGVYMGAGGEKVFVKPVMDETAAVAEMRGTQIARQAHGLKAPEQRIVVISDPQDVTGTRRFLALESKLDSTFVNNDPMALFNEEQYFKQLVASLLRVDKDLAAGNLFGNVVADVGPAGVFTRASGVRALEPNLPSMEDQAMINLLGIKGGAKRAFAESTLGLMAGLTPQQYHQRMIAEIQQVLPMLKQTVASFGLTNPAEVDVYQAMIRRLEQGLSTDWSKFHAIHSAVKPTAPKQTAMKVAGYADGVVSVPGPKGAGDIVPAMLSPGEAVIPAEESKKYAPLINAMISGNIPGFNKGRKTQSESIEQFREKGSMSMQASHFDFAAPGVMASTIESLSEELGDYTVKLYKLSEKLEDGSRDLEFSSAKLADLGGQELDIAAGGRVYGATTKRETTDRNQAMRVAKIDGTPFTLEGAVAAGKKAEEALLLTGKEATKYGNEFRAMVEEAKIAKQLLTSKNSSDEKLSYMLNNATESITQAYHSGASSAGRAMPIEKARDLATEKLSAVTDKYRKAVEGGMDETLALEKAQRELQAEMLMASGTYAAGPGGTGGGILRDVATGRASFNPDTSRGKLNNKVPQGENRQPSAGSDTAVIAGAVFADLEKNGFDTIKANLQMIKSGFMRALKGGLGISSPSREFAEISKDVSDGVKQGSDDATAAGKELGKKVTQAVREPGSSFVKPTTPTPRQTESFRLSKPAVQAPEAVKIAQNAGQDSMGPLKAYFTMVRSNLRDSLKDSQQEFRSIFAKSADLSAAGKTAAQKVREGIEAANPQITIDGKKMGINFAAAAAGRQGGVEAIITKKTAELVSAANKVYNSGIRELPKQGASAFKIAGDGIVQEITKSAMARARVLGPAVGNVISDSVLGRVNMGGSFGITAPAGDSTPLKNRPKNKLENFQELNSQLMTLSFAFSSIASVTSMFGEDMGFINDALYGFSNGVLALTGIMQLLTIFQGGQIATLIDSIVATKVKTAAFIANTKAVIQNSIAQTFSGGAISGLGKIGAKVSSIFVKVVGAARSLFMIFGRFLPVIGLAIAAFTVFKVITDLQEQQKKKIEGMGNAASLAGEKLTAFAALSGFTPTRDSSKTFETSKAQSGTGLNAEEATQSVNIASTEQFKTEIGEGGQFYQDVQNLKAATLAEAQAAMSALMIKAIALAPEGTDIATIKATVAAIADAAGQTGVSLELPVTLNPFESGNEQKVLEYLRGLRDNPDFNLNPEIIPAKPATTLLTKGTDATIRPEDAADANQFGAAASASLEQLNTQLIAGKMSASQYNTSVIGVLAEVSSLGEVSRDIAYLKVFEGYGVPADVVNGIEDLQSRMLLLRAFAVGAPVKDTDAATLAAADEPNATQAQKNAGLDVEARLRNDVAAAAKRQANEIKEKQKADQAAQASVDLSAIEEELNALDANDKILPRINSKTKSLAESYEILGNEKYRNILLSAQQADQDAGKGGTENFDKAIANIQELTSAQEKAQKQRELDVAPENLDDYIADLEKENKTKKDLEAAGFSAAEAQEILNNEIYIAGYNAAVANGTLDKFLVQMKKIGELSPDEETSGGTPEQTPFEKAVEDLKEQRKQLKQTLSAYNKLRQGGFSVAQAFEAAKDPITAAAVASTKVGTPKWRELVSLLKETDKLAAASRLRDLTRGNMSELFLKKDLDSVSKSLEKAGYSAEQVQAVLDDMQSDPANAKRLAKDLKDGKVDAKDIREYLKSIRSVKVEVSIEDLESKVSAAFSQVSELFSARREAIEIDFEFGTNDSGKNAINPFTGKIFNTKQIDKEIKQAEQYIAERQFKIDDNEYQLQGIQDKEDKINETYDKRIEALSDINDINDELAQQQKAQLTLADALTSGDMASAARAVQDMRAQAAEKAAADQEKLLEKARDAELKAVRSQDGRSRVQIETTIRDLKQEIIEKEEKILEPAQRALDLANDYKDAAFDSIDYLGKNESEWKKIEAGVKLAKVEAEAYKKAIEDALLLIPKLQAAYAGAQEDVNIVNGKDSATARQEEINNLNARLQANRDIVTKDKSITPQDRLLMAENVEILNKLRIFGSELSGGDSGNLAFASGGFVSGPGTPTSDSIPAMLSNGEYVINAKTTKQIGLDTLNAINFGKVSGFAKGGLVKPKYFNAGGMVKAYARGGDVVPSMLTPGEFVMSKYAVQNYGVDKMKALNNGTLSNDSVYNYSVNVSVQTDSNPDQIARAVLGQIKQIDAQRIRGNRF